MDNEPLKSDNGETQKPFDMTSPWSEFHPGGTIDGSNLSGKEDTVMASIQENLQGLLMGFSELRQDFDVKVKYDESKERLIERLHHELQEYKEGLHFRILKPIFIDLIAMHDDLDKQIERIAQNNSPLSREMQQHLKLFQETIEETLRRNDVDTFSIEEDVFIPSKQKICRVVPTNDLTLDRHIARRVRKGFLCGARLLRHEIVEAYKYMPITNS